MMVIFLSVSFVTSYHGKNNLSFDYSHENIPDF